MNEVPRPNSLVTQMLGDDAIISSDFGGNPPYEKMKEVARICFKHWIRQSNVLFIIGMSTPGTVWIDDVSVSYTPGAPAP